ncbi:MAG: invasion associated locus B family protein [Alphaproteobacteria bacterium]
MNHPIQALVALALVTALAAPVLAPHPALAVEKKAAPAKKGTEKPPEQKPGESHLGRFGEWDVFTATEAKAKTCYMATIARSDSTKREKAYVLVMHRPAQKALGVVSMTSSGPLKDKSEGEAEIGGEKFLLYTSSRTPDTAWSFDDAKLLQAMLKGTTMIVRTAPAKGNAMADNYSLDGISKAYAEMNKACGVK